MSETHPTRRDVLKKSVVTGATVGLASAALPLKSWAAAAGANERIRLGVIGCGNKNTWNVQWIKHAAAKHPVAIVAACDIWPQKRENYANVAEQHFGAKPRLHEDYHEVLDAKDVDAVVIATPDHQHCGMLVDAVKAGKDVYVEKPISMSLDELNKTYDAVTASKAIVQHGTQGRSFAGAAAAKAFYQSGKLGKLVCVRESYSHYLPYWNHYPCPEKESDTNWKAFLFNRPYQPFDADKHGAWMGYREFSFGPIGGWMAHFSDFIHWYTECDFPKTAVCTGGIVSPTSDPRRTCPDNVTGVLEYGEGFFTQFSTHFGNGADNHTCFYGTKGTMRTAMLDGWPNGIAARVSGEGSDHPDRVKEEIVLDNTTDEDHMENWLRCLEERKQPNANMDAGYKQGVAVIMADMAMVAGRKMMFDPAKREIRPV